MAMQLNNGAVHFGNIINHGIIKVAAALMRLLINVRIMSRICLRTVNVLIVEGMGEYKNYLEGSFVLSTN
jgi:hypothetical protein